MSSEAKKNKAQIKDLKHLIQTYIKRAEYQPKANLYESEIHLQKQIDKMKTDFEAKQIYEVLNSEKRQEALMTDRII